MLYTSTDVSAIDIFFAFAIKARAACTSQWWLEIDSELFFNVVSNDRRCHSPAGITLLA